MSHPMMSVFWHLLSIFYPWAQMQLLTASLSFIIMFMHWTNDNHWVKKYKTILSMYIVPHCYFLCKHSAQHCQRGFFLMLIFCWHQNLCTISLHSLVITSHWNSFCLYLLTIINPGKMLFLVLLAFIHPKCQISGVDTYATTSTIFTGYGQVCSQYNSFSTTVFASITNPLLQWKR